MRFALIAGVAMVVATPAAAQDWSGSIATTPAGSYVRGNPDASVKLVEYISFTCSHCAQFIGEAAATLDARIKSGNTSVELRHAVRDPLDLTASVLARCAGPRRFAGHTRAIMAAQSRWLAKGGDWARANAEPLKTMPIAAQLQGFANGSGLMALMRARGLTPARANACLANGDEHRLLSAQAAASFAVISGTPSFAIDGKVIPDVHRWSALQPHLSAAGSR